MATLSDMLSSITPSGTTLANAGSILGQGLARRGGLLGLPLGALIGGASQSALQQRQQNVQSTLANQIRSYAAQSKDPAEQAQLHMAANMASAGMDPSSLLHIAKTAAARPNFKTLHNVKGELTGAWDPATGQFVPPPTQGAFDTVPKAASANTPFAAYAQGYLATHPGDEAGAAQYAQSQISNNAVSLAGAEARAREMPSYSLHDVDGKALLINNHNPNDRRVIGNAPAGSSSGSEIPINPNDIGTDASGKPVIAMRGKDGTTKVVPLPAGYNPPVKKSSKGPAAKLPVRGVLPWNGYKYATIKNPDGSMVASLAEKPGIGTELLHHYGLAAKPPATLYFKPGSTKPIALPPGVNPADVESVP